MTVARVLFAYPNYADGQLSPTTTGVQTTLTPTFSGGSWEATLPLTNLATPYLFETARSTDALAASTTFDVDLKTARDILCVGLVRHNLSQAATVTITGASDAAFTSIVYASGAINVFPAARFAPGSMPYGWPTTWAGLPTTEDVAYYKSLAFVQVIDTLQTARYWRIAITDTTNGNGYVELGRVFVAPGYIPDVNISQGMTLGWTSETTADSSVGSVKFFTVRNQARELVGTIQNVSIDQALGFLHDMQGRLGLDQQLMVVVDPTDTYHRHRRSFLATLKQLDPITIAIYGTATVHAAEVL